MSLILEIPDEVVAAVGPTRECATRALLLDLAIVLYSRGSVSAGKAAELAGIARGDFERALGVRGVERNYTAEDLAADLS